MSALLSAHTLGASSMVEGLGELRPCACPREVFDADAFTRFERWAGAVLGVAVERVERRDGTAVVIVYGTAWMVALVDGLGVFGPSTRLVRGAS